MSIAPKSILFLTSQPEQIGRFQSLLKSSTLFKISGELAPLAEVQDRLARVQNDHDAILLDLGRCNPDAIAGLPAVLAAQTGVTPVLAVADENAPLASIRSILDAGIADVLPETVSERDLEAALTKAVVEPAAAQTVQPSQNLSIVLPVMASRGGAGATTVATNLAIALMAPQHGRFKKGPERSVALLDFDLQFGDAHVLLDVEDNGGMLQLMETGPQPDGRQMLQAMSRHDSGLYVLSAPHQMAPLSILTAEFVAGLIAAARAQFDYTVINLPRAMTDWMPAVLDATSALTIVTTDTVTGVRNTRRILTLLEEDYAGLFVNLVVNKFESGSLFGSKPKDIEAALGRDIPHALPFSAAAIDCGEIGKPLILQKSGDKLAKKVRDIAAGLDGALASVQDGSLEAVHV